MLMAAVTSTSLGTDIATARPATAEQTERAGMSFAENFVESTAHTEETALSVAASTKGNAKVDGDFAVGKDSIGTSSSVVSEIIPAINVAGKVQGGTEKVKPSALPVAAASAPATNKTNAGVIVATLQQSGKSDGRTDSVSQAKMPDDKVLSAAPEIEDNQPQQIESEAAESAIGGPVAVAPPDPQIAAPAAVPATDPEGRLVIADKNGVPISDKTQGENLGGKVIKDHGASIKTGKGAKAEDKPEKGGVAVSAVGTEAQAAVLAQVFVNPAGEQPTGSKAASDKDVLAAGPSSASARKGEIAVTAKDKNGKEATSAVKPGGAMGKAPGASSAENQVSQKPEADTTKAGSMVANNLDDEKSKGQSPAFSVTDPSQPHSAPISFGSASGAVAGGEVTHTMATTPSATEAISHAVASAQAGSSSVDTAAPAETAPHTLIATPTSLEVGVSNGTHGWLKIRAEMADGGAVNTSLSPSSITGQQMLHRELPSLAAYLKSEHVAVNAVVVQPMPANGSDARGFFGGTGGNGHGQAQQSGSQARQGQQNAGTPAPGVTSALYSGPGTVGEDEVFPSTSYLPGGGWLSVRA